MREAIPVGRFSSSPQEHGDSEARQQKAIRRILKRHKLRLSKRYEAIFDRSRSAFKGEHLSAGNLGKFLAKVKNGEVKPDANGEMPVLMFEAVDRLTRLHPLEATDLLRRLVKEGFALVFDEGDMWIDSATIGDEWIRLQVSIEQAWRYSQRLQGRILSSWDNKRKAKKPTTTICPSWISWDAEKEQFVKNDFAETLRQACLMSIAGHGASEIRKQLKITTAQQNLILLFHKIELMGHHYHKRRNKDGSRSKVGEVIKDYYPPLLSEKEFYQLQEAIESRASFKGRRGEHCSNLFTHLLICSADKTELLVKGRNKNRPSVLVSRAKRRGESKHPCLWYQIVEDALLTLFVRLKASDLMPCPKQDETKLDKLEGTLKQLKHRHKQYVKEQLDNPDRDYAPLIDGLYKKIREVEIELQEEKKKNPTAHTLKNTQDAIDFMNGLGGKKLLDARVRAKQLIRELVKSVEVEIFSSRSAGFKVFLHDGTILIGETAKVGKIQITTKNLD